MTFAFRHKRHSSVEVFGILFLMISSSGSLKPETRTVYFHLNLLAASVVSLWLVTADILADRVESVGP